MANAPVESFKHGGLLWFKDLTVPDPYFGVPFITCVTLYGVIKVFDYYTNHHSMAGYFSCDVESPSYQSYSLVLHFSGWR